MYLALGSYETACKTAMKTLILKNILQDLFVKTMDNECREMCKASNGSLLKKIGATELANFKLSDFCEELRTNAPMTAKTLTSLCQSRRSRKEICDPNIISTIGAIILYSRCPDMSALSYRLGFLLRHAGAAWYVSH